MAKFKREVIRCAKDKGNRKATAVFGVDGSNVRLWQKHNAVIRGCEASQKKFTGPKKGLLLLIKRYNLYKVLACSAAFFQLSLFCAIFFQL